MRLRKSVVGSRGAAIILNDACCPVIFYTGSYYESEAYQAMVDRLLELQEKWEIGVIDLYTDEKFNDIDEDTYNLYMYDKVHPTKAGYLEWWTPEIEEYLYTFLQ